MNNNKHIILHLRCSTEQYNNYIKHKSNILQYNPDIVPEGVEPIDETKINEQYTYINNSKIKPINYYKKNIQEKKYDDQELMKQYQELKSHIHKNLFEKIKHIQKELQHNDIDNTKSCCFWDTYPIDGPQVLIPINQHSGVGCFCSPECAAAYLLNDNTIDDTTRWERYTLLHNIYKDCYDGDYINPSPNPHYLLKSFLGKLSIEEYREMVRLNTTLWIIVDKPLTRILPELHEEKETTDKSSDYRLYRKKPIVKKKSVWSNLIYS